MTRFSIAFLFLAALFAVGTARASTQGVLVTRNWKQMDLCAQQAQAAFPDFTPEANAKREASLKQCLAGKNLPPRAPLAPRP
jgi:hypothetical protein